MSNQDISAFWSLTISAILYIIINATLKSIQTFLASLLSIIWRKTLTHHIHSIYFTQLRFYYLQVGKQVDENSELLSSSPEGLDLGFSRLDNPDQRIAQDINSLCTSLASIIPLLIVTPFVIGWYGYQVR